MNFLFTINKLLQAALKLNTEGRGEKMLLLPSCSAKESELGHVSKGSSWGSGVSSSGASPTPTGVLGMI